MFPSSFEYHRASSVKDALALLSQFGDDAKILSGGHSLLPMMKLRLAQPAHLLDIGAVRELAQIKEEGGRVVSADSRRIVQSRPRRSCARNFRCSPSARR